MNNGGTIRMQGLTGAFAEAGPDTEVERATLEENVLGQRVATDIAAKGR